MLFRNRYVITENIERFEALLGEGRLDGQQTDTVEVLLAEARAELAEFDSCNGTHLHAPEHVLRLSQLTD